MTPKCIAKMKNAEGGGETAQKGGQMKVIRRFIVELELEIDEHNKNDGFELIRQDIESELSCCSHFWDKIIVKEVEQ